MLPRDQRLSRHQDINRVYQRGRFGMAEGLQVKTLRNNLTGSRVVVVVSKKVSKKAVVRNRLRRQVAGRLAALWPGLSLGQDIVITVREDMAKVPPAELEKRLKAALTRAGGVK